MRYAKVLVTSSYTLVCATPERIAQMYLMLLHEFLSPTHPAAGALSTGSRRSKLHPRRDIARVGRVDCFSKNEFATTGASDFSGSHVQLFQCFKANFLAMDDLHSPCESL